MCRTFNTRCLIAFVIKGTRECSYPLGNRPNRILRSIREVMSRKIAHSPLERRKSQVVGDNCRQSVSLSPSQISFRLNHIRLSTHTSLKPQSRQTQSFP